MGAGEGLLSLLEVRGGKLKGITCQGRGGDMSSCSRDLLAACSVPPALGWRTLGGRDVMGELSGGKGSWIVSPL